MSADLDEAWLDTQSKALCVVHISTCTVHVYLPTSLQAIHYTYDCVSGHASSTCKYELSIFKEEMANLCEDRKPSQQWRMVALKRTGKLCQSVIWLGKAIQ